MLVPVLISPAVFSGATAAITTSAALATTYTGLCLTNPINSPVTLTLETASFAPLVAQAATRTIGLLGGYSATTAVTQTTAITPVCNTPIGAISPGYGLLASAATIVGTPALLFLFGALDTGAITVSENAGAYISLRLNNGYPSVIIPPGAYVAFYTSTASTASSLALSFQWGEQ